MAGDIILFAKSPETTAVRAAELVPSEIVEGFEEPQGLHYLSTPMQVERSTTPNGTAVFTVLPHHQPLDGTALFALLQRTAPNPRFDSIQGVVADWDIVDQRGENSKYLVNLHGRLGEPWHEFLKSRRAFLDTFIDSKPPMWGFSSRPYFLQEDAQRLLPLHGLRQEALGNVASSFDAAVEFLESKGVPNAGATMLTAVRRAINSRRHKDRQLANEQSIKASARKKDLINAMSRLLPRDFLSSVDQLEPLVYAAVEDERGNTYKFRRSAYDPAVFEQDLANRETVTKGAYRAEVITLSGLKHAGRFYGKFIIPGSQRREEAARFIVSPVIKWSRDRQGERKFVFERSMVPDEGSIHQRDGVLGALLVAYLSPRITERWPKSMKIGASLNQAMGVAQVPVLALFPKYQQQLLQSELITAAEALVA